MNVWLVIWVINTSDMYVQYYYLEVSTCVTQKCVKSKNVQVCIIGRFYCSMKLQMSLLHFYMYTRTLGTNK